MCRPVPQSTRIETGTDRKPWSSELFRTIDASSLDLGGLFEASPNAYVIFDEALNLVGCNDVYLSVVGRSRDDIVGRYLFDAFPSSPESASYILLRRSLDKVLTTHEPDHIAVIPYDTSAPNQAPNMRYWSATHTPIFDAQGRFRYILQHTVDITELQKLRERGSRELIAEAGVLQRAKKVQEQNQAIDAESKLLREMFKQAPGFMGILAGPAHQFILANEAYKRLVGDRDLVGLTVAEALPEVVDQGFIDLLDQVYRSGEPYVGAATPVMLRQQNGKLHTQRFVDFVFQPIFTSDDEVSGIFVQGHDVTEKVEAERLQTLRQRELGHRLKNQLAMIQAIVNQTLRSSTNLESAGRTISARMQALASAHELLISGTSGRTTVGEIVRKTMEIHDDRRKPRIRADGPDVQIASRPALSLSLILHELSTNATKYGALSSDSGTVNLTWSVEQTVDAPKFRFVWREQGGPAVKPPARTGAGSRLIKAGLAGTLECNVEMVFNPTGVVCELTARLDGFQREKMLDYGLGTEGLLEASVPAPIISDESTQSGRP